MEEIRHWPIACKECTSAAKYNCNTCDITLCLHCNEKHSKSVETKHHTIVPYCERIKPVSRKCRIHQGHVLDVWCDNCNCAVCIKCVTSECHKGHVFVDFSEKLKQQTATLQKGLEEASRLVSLSQKYIQKLEKEEGTLNEIYERITLDIEAQAESICSAVHQVSSVSIKALKDHKEKCFQMRREHRISITESSEIFNREIKKYDDILRSEDVISILEYVPDQMLQRNMSPTVIFRSELPDFHRGNVDINSLKIMIGHLDLKGNINDESSDFLRRKQSHSDSNASRAITKSYHPPNTFLEWYVVRTNWISPSTIICKDDGQAWITTNNQTIQLVDKSGNMKEKRDFEFEVRDASMTLSGDLLLLDDKTYSIRILSGTDRLSVFALWHVGMEPYALCSLHNDEIVIAFRKDNKVIKYSQSGSLLKDFSRLAMESYRPCNLVQNRVNKQIYLTTKKGNGFYQDAGRVLAYTINGDCVNAYDGPSDADFTPVDVCTDNRGQVYITDYVHNRVHILSIDSKFIDYLNLPDGALEKPCKIDINNFNYLWISENSTRNVKIFRIDESSKQDRRSDMLSEKSSR